MLHAPLLLFGFAQEQGFFCSEAREAKCPIRGLQINNIIFYFQDLRTAKKQFEIIVLQHKNVDFPLAYLGTGRVFYKQNRYFIIHLKQSIQY